MEQVYKSTGRMPQQLAEHGPVPEDTSYIWDWYLSMRTGAPLTWGEISGWQSVYKVELTVWESELIRSLDRIYYKELRDD